MEFIKPKRLENLNALLACKAQLIWSGLLVLASAVLMSSSAFAQFQPGSSGKQPFDPPPGVAFPEIGVVVSGPEACETGGLPSICSYSVRIANYGEAAYTGTLFFQDTIFDNLPLEPGSGFAYPQMWRYSYRALRCTPVSSVIGFACEADTIGAGLRCSRGGGGVSCGYPLANLEPGASLTFKFEFLLPEGLENSGVVLARGGIYNCASVFWPMKSAAYDDGRHAIVVVATELWRLGYLHLPAMNDPATLSAAIRRYQSDHELEETGAVDDALMRSLFPRSAQMRGDENVSNDSACVTTPVTGASK